MARRKRASELWTAPQVPDGWTPTITSREDIAPLIDRLPLSPGVYLMRDREGHVVYVGKARRLRVRVKQYFSGHDERYFVPLLGDLLGDIETMVVESDKEALLLENSLIKQHRPRFNFRLRDDKQYLVLRMDPKATWPRLDLVRNIEADGARYWGPYHSASSVRSTLKVINRHFQLRTCSDHVLRTRKRPCLQYQIGRCPAPCVYEIDPDAYATQVKNAEQFLSGRRSALTQALAARMREASEVMEYERAARIRDQLRAVERSLVRQRVIKADEADVDCVGLYREGGLVEIAILHVRGGELIGHQTFSQRELELSDVRVVHDFLRAYYEHPPYVPDEILVPVELDEDDREPLEQALRERRGKKVVIRCPQRGDRKKLVSLATKNAGSSFVSRRDRGRDVASAMAQLQRRLNLSRTPHHIECYDISHIQGQDPVASMVVFRDGAADTSSYRNFKIKGREGDAAQTRQNDDFASMEEVLTRRLRRGLEGEDERWALPDLLVIDGGKGQLSRVVRVLEDLGVELGPGGVDVVALAKERASTVRMDRRGLARLSEFRARDAAPAHDASAIPETDATGTDAVASNPGETLRAYELAQTHAADAGTQEEARTRPERVFTPGSRDPIVLRAGTSELHLMTQIRDEAHRFAITHHRKRRGQRALQSALDQVPGVGPATKRALLEHFKTMAAIKTADEDALRQVRGVGPALARTLRLHLGR